MNYIKQNHLSLLIILWLVVTGLFFGGGSKFGASQVNLTTIGNPWTFTSTGGNNGVTMASSTATAFKVGQTGTKLSRVNAGTCYILAYATTIAASSTAAVDCQATALIYNITTARAAALPGVTAADFVVAKLATSTAGTTSNGLVLTAASASTTAGYITLYVSNLTGTTFTWPVTGTATGTASYIVVK